MLFKLSVKNMKKSIRDYAIYFATLILGVAIFYIFNSLDSQQAMKVISSSAREIIQLLVELLSGLSVFVSFILGFLIVYANNFLIRRRKKEFGIYMTLGMGKGAISRILLTETVLIGLVSLAVGLLVGIFGAQFMSLLVVNMFDGVMDGYQFVFSRTAFFKTILYFGIIFLIVAVFQVVSLSRYRLIQLLSARNRNEQVKIKNPRLCFLVFLAAFGILGVQYYRVCNPENMHYREIPLILAAGAVGTFLVFWSMSGFLLSGVQRSRKVYFRDLNAFVLRQFHSKINTTVFVMTVICLMLFMTISVLAGGLGLNYSFRQSLKELTPADVNFVSMDTSLLHTKSAARQLQDTGFDMGLLQEDYVEVSQYSTEELTICDTIEEQVREESQYDVPKNQEMIMKVSDYNKIAEFYGIQQAEVPEGTYAVICDFDMIRELRDASLEKGQELTLEGKTYKPAYKECLQGFLQMYANHANVGIILLPDDQVEEAWRTQNFLAANYKAETRQEKEAIEEQVQIYGKQGFLVSTRIEIVETSGGLSAILTLIAIYLGIVFLISGAAILALKELSESTDNKERYEILRKIGADEKMIRRALFRQIALFFFLPLGVALVHSVFGLTFCAKILESVGKIESFRSILSTAAILVAVYGGYFFITYRGSCRIIKSR